MDGSFGGGSDMHVVGGETPTKEIDKMVLELSLRFMSEAFNDFVTECMSDEGEPKMPTKQALMKARGFLPPYCSQSYKRKVKPA